MLLRSRIVITPGWETVLRAHGLDSVEGVYQLGSGETIKRSGSVEVRQVPLGKGAVFLKNYWVGKPSQLWSGLFRGTLFGRAKARTEYENLARLRAWQLDAPEPVAYGEERRAGLLLRSFLISEGVPNPMPLHVFIRDRLPALPAEESRHARGELIERLAHCTRRLHEHGFVHHDYFWRNILLSGGDLTRFFLIDAHKGRCWRPGGEQRGRAEDLAALDAPAPRFFRRTERLRFFLLYRGHPPSAAAVSDQPGLAFTAPLLRRTGRRLDARDKELLRLAMRLAAPMREKQLRRALGLGRPK